MIVEADPSPDPAVAPSRGLLRRAVELSAVVVVVLVTGFSQHWRPSGLTGATSQNGMHTATGYEALIRNVFIKRHWLIAHLQTDGPDSMPVVTLRASVRSELHKVYRATYLREDVQAEDPKRWRFSGDELKGIEPSAHTSPGPFARARRWQGDILYASSDFDEEAISMLLEGASGNLELAERPAGWTTIQGSPLLDTLLVSSPSSTTSAAGYTLVTAPDRAGHTPNRPIVAIWRAGDMMFLRRLSDWAGAVSVNGVPLTPQSGNAAYAALYNGQSLTVSDGNGLNSTWRLQVRRPNDGTSGRAGESARSDPEVQPLSDGLVAAMQRGTEAGVFSPHQSLVLTLRQPIQSEAQRQLALACGDLRPLTHYKTTFVCADIVMDAFTGEIWAAASYPTTKEDLLVAEKASREGRELLEQNHNFSRLTIGSVAKIPFSAAITNHYPKFTNLTVEAAGMDGPVTANGAHKRGFASLLGQPLERPIEEEANLSGQMGFQAFICHSSNKYASAMMLLATAPDPFARNGPPAGEEYHLDGQTRRDLPPGIAQTEAVGADGSGILVRRAGAFDSSFGSTWPRDMANLFDVSGLEAVDDRSRGKGNLSDAYDLGPWRGLSIGNTRGISTAFARVSPEREFFALDNVTSLRDDYLQLIMGSGAGRWTTVKTAEVFSRLVTGDTGVQATLSPVTQQTDREATGLDRPTFSPARNELVSAMEQVAGGDCSGKGMGPARQTFATKLAGIDPSLEVRLFAKTGTPTIEVARPTQVDSALNELLNAGLLRVDPTDLTLARGAVADHGSIENSLSLDGDAQRELHDYGISASAAAKRIDQINQDPRRRYLLVRDESDLDAYWIKAQDVTEHDGSVFAFTAGVYRRSGGEASHPLAAMTVVVNIQGRQWLGPNTLGPNAAIPVAARLLNGAAGDRLIAEARKRIHDGGDQSVRH